MCMDIYDVLIHGIMFHTVTTTYYSTRGSMISIYCKRLSTTGKTSELRAMEKCSVSVVYREDARFIDLSRSTWVENAYRRPSRWRLDDPRKSWLLRDTWIRTFLRKRLSDTWYVFIRFGRVHLTFIRATTTNGDARCWNDKWQIAFVK